MATAVPTGGAVGRQTAVDIATLLRSKRRGLATDQRSTNTVWPTPRDRNPTRCSDALVVERDSLVDGRVPTAHMRRYGWGERDSEPGGVVAWIGETVVEIAAVFL